MNNPNDRPWKPGEVYTVDGVEYAIVTISDAAADDDADIEAMGRALGRTLGLGDDSLCSGCPYRRTCTGTNTRCGNGYTTGTTIIVPLSAVPILALEGVLE